MPFTASGIDPSQLRRVRFELRHSAAMTESRAHFLSLVEASTEGAMDDDPERLQTPEGRAAYAAYRQRVFVWATAGPDTAVSYTDEEFDKLFGPRVTDAQAR